MKSIGYLLAAIFFVSSSINAEKTTLTLLSVADVYEMNPVNKWGGIPELMTLLEQERTSAAHSLTTLNGDFLGGSLASTIFKGKQMVELLNALKVNLVVFGNHEFDMGSELLKDRIKESKFVWLGSNVLDHSGNPYGGSVSTKMYVFDGIKVGFFGVCLEEAKTLSSPGPDIVFAPVIPAAEKAVKELKEAGADVIVAITHENLTDDRSLAKLHEVDVILGGHEHYVITWDQEGTLIMKPGSDAAYLCRLDLSIEKEKDKKATVIPEWKMIPNYNVTPDSAIAEIVGKYEKELSVVFDQPLAKLESPLDSRGQVVRSQETAIGDLFADAIRDETGAEIVILNGGTIRGNREYPANIELKRRDIFNELPYPTKVAIVSISGSDVIASIEDGLNQADTHGGGFPQVAGLSYTWNPRKAPGNRVVEVQVDGKILDPEKMYRLAVNSYILEGGDGYIALKHGKLLNNLESAKTLSMIVVDYLSKMKSVSPHVEGRIKEVEK